MRSTTETPAAADDLRAEEAVRALREKHLHRHHFAAGIIARVAHGREIDLVIVDPGRLRGLLVQAGVGGGEIEELDDGGALRALVMAVETADVVRRDAALLVRGAGQRDERGLARDKMPHLP